MTLQPVIAASLAIQVHIFSALAALVLGGFILFRKKGDWRHRIGGRLWVALMLTVAFSSLLIHELNVWGSWSPIHLISLWVIGSMAVAVWSIRTGNVRRHQWTMKATYVGGLIVAGLFTFVPGRLMYEVMFGIG